METGIYILLAAIVYGILADRLDRSADQEDQKRRRPVALTTVSGDLPPTPLEEPTRRDVLRTPNRRVVRKHRVVTPSKATQQIGADRVKQVVPIQLERVDDREAGSRAAQLSNSNRTIQRDDRTRRNRHLLII